MVQTAHVRLATVSDLEHEYGVFLAAQRELHHRRGVAWGTGVTGYDPSGRWAAIHRHLLAHDGDRSLVAEVEGRIVGFTAAWVRGGCWFFSALFVHPDYQGRGIGQELLESVWGGPYLRRVTVTEAIQPVSTAVYARRGLLPVTPILEFSGQPRAHLEGELKAGPWDPVAVAAIDAAAYGFDRSVDHQLWRALSETATLWSRAGEAVAYSYRGSLGIAPLAGVDHSAAAAALREELARSVGQEVMVSIPGSAPRLLEVALGAGLKLGDPGLFLVSPADWAPDSIALHSYWLL